MIYDMHCHILPGVDDGARDMKDTERMLRTAHAEGIDRMLVTPHFQCGGRCAEVEELKKQYAKVQELWTQYGTDKELYLGSELFYSEGVVDALQAGEALTLNGTRYILVEFPIYVEFPYVLRAVQKLRYAGYRPIVAHVERYEKMQRPDCMRELMRAGAVMQVNVSTLLGRHGFFARYRMTTYLKKGLVQLVGTDAHDTKERKPVMKECRLYLTKKLGETRAQEILESNPERILRGEELHG